jgi:GMP synthase PP-ATPase subunit
MPSSRAAQTARDPAVEYVLRKPRQAQYDEVEGVNSDVDETSSKPPGTIEWD